MATIEKIKVGVVGVGYLGQHHARLWAGHKGAELVGVADPAPGRAAEIAKQYKTKGYDDPAALLGQVRAVSIAAPTTDHHRLARMFLEAGVDVLVEKPMTVTTEEADDLVALAAAGGRILQVGHLERFNAAVRALFDRATTPMFIECNRLSPFPDRSTDVDVTLDLMIHDIDIILSLVRSPVRAISAVGIPVISGNVDIANARLEFESGCVANVTASRISMKKERKIRVFQPDTYLSLDYQNQELYAYNRIPGGTPGSKPLIEGGKVSIDKQEPLKVELEAFLDAVRHRTRPLVSGIEGRDALAMALRVADAIDAHTFPPELS